MLSKLTVAGIGIAAAALIGAPIAAADGADLSNTDVMQAQQRTTRIVDPWEELPGTAPFKNGLNPPTMQPTIYSGPDCKPVMGTWDDAGFHPDPNGTDIAFGTKDNLKRHPFKTGCNHC